MFAKLARTLTRLNFQSLNRKVAFCFSAVNSEHAKDIDYIKERAEVSNELIKMISGRPNQLELEFEQINQSPDSLPKIQNMKKLSLCERIKKVLSESKKYQRTKREILNLFESGIQIPKQVFSQERITQSFNRQMKILYCPNSMITKQIFQILSRKNPITGDRFVVKGYWGISKTVSTSLFWLLSRYIDDYRFSEQVKPGLAQKSDVRKVVYWTIQEQNSLNSVIKSILEQCPELKNEKKPSKILKQESWFKDWYREKYGIQTLLIIDQINSLAKFYRQIKQLQQKTNRTKQEDRDLKKLRSKFTKLIDIVLTLAKQFDMVVYLSSMAIELDFLNKYDLAASIMHTIVKTYDVEYANIIHKPESLIDLCHYFLFEFKQRFYLQKKLKCSQKIFEQVQAECFQYLKQKGKGFFITPLNIRQEVRRLRAPQESMDQNQIKSVLIQQFKEMINRSTSTTQKEFQAHFLKHDSLDGERKFLMLELYNKIREIATTQNQEKLSDVSSKQMIKIKLSDLKETQQSVSKILDNRYFSVDSYDITLRLPAELMLNVIQPKLGDWLRFYLKREKKFMEKFINLQDMGNLIENMFIYVLKQGKTNFWFQLNQKGTKEKVHQFRNIRMGSYRFSPLPTTEKQKSTYSFLEKLVPCFQKMMKKQQNCSVFEPVKLQYMKKELALDNVKPSQCRSNNPCVDCLLVKAKPQGQERIDIYAIDFTTNRNSKKNTEDKIFSFINSYLNFKDLHQTSILLNDRETKVQLKYFVFGEENQIPDFTQKLNQSSEFKGKIKFEETKWSNKWKVLQVKKKSQSLLKEIGFIKLVDDCGFDKTDDSDVACLLEAFKELNEKRKN